MHAGAGLGESVLLRFDAFGFSLLISTDQSVKSQWSYQRIEDGGVAFKPSRNLSKAIDATAHEHSRSPPLQRLLTAFWQLLEVGESQLQNISSLEAQ